MEYKFGCFKSAESAYVYKSNFTHPSEGDVIHFCVKRDAIQKSLM